MEPEEEEVEEEEEAEEELDLSTQDTVRNSSNLQIRLRSAHRNGDWSFL
jgi:hypothetical protein